jgi:hypothetical protein
MKLLSDYLRGLTDYVGRAWNQYWFAPSDGLDLSVMRIAVGLLLLAWQLSFTPDLLAWFGPDGWFNATLYDRLVTSQATGTSSALDHLSYLFVSSPGLLWVLHAGSAVVLLLFTLGAWTRVTSVLAWCVMLAYIHRAPFLAGPAESVLVALVAYLALGRSGDYLSLDARRGARASGGAAQPSSLTTVARRLMQIHVVLFYLAFLSSQIAAATWWRGDAMWWLAAQQQSPLLDLRWMREQPFLVNLWTHGFLLSELALVAFVWNPWLRPLVLLFSSLAWCSLAVASGNLPLAATMIVAHLAWVPSSFWQARGLGGTLVPAR